MEDNARPWLLIDGNNWFARDFYASADGASVCFTMRIRDCVRQLQPSRVCIAWDVARSFRHELHPGYKSGRADKPNGFGTALEAMRAGLYDHPLIEGMTVEQYRVDGFEADDVLASITADGLDEGCRVLICSSDRDLHQLLAAGYVTQILQCDRPRPGVIQPKYMTAAMLHQATGVHPWQWVDYKTLVGDKSDNVPGCPDIGKKTAADLLTSCGSLDKFYKSPWKAPITNRQQASLMDFRTERLELVRALLTLRRDAMASAEVA